jgi:aspartyl protease family protein
MSAGGNLFWTALIVAGVALIAPGLRVDAPDPAPADGTATPSPSPATEVPTGTSAGSPAGASAGNGHASQELVRDRNGHFYAEAQVNGARIRFMIDTGASVVALTREDAQRAGIAFGSERSRAIGAGGEVEVIPVTIDRIAIGPLEAREIRGAIADNLPVSLLGQSFLSRVGSVEIRGDRMVLR